MTVPDRHRAREIERLSAPDSRVSALEELEGRVRELERELTLRDEFIAAVGHELRNPISPVFLHIQRMIAAARKADGGVVASAWLLPQLEQFERRMHKLLNALNRMLDVSRIDAGRIELTLEPVEWVEVIRDVSATYERELEAARSTLELRLPEALWARGDRLRLEQIVSNLLSNAIRYGAGQPIELSLRALGEQVELRVRDQGIGIAPEDVPRIFRRFERLEAGAYRGGFGVGLWLVDRLCTALGGGIRVESQPGQGSTFIVNLPLDNIESAL